MSLETWKAEFYPVEAEEVGTTDAVAHSLRKWEGLREENLARHEVEVSRGRIGLVPVGITDIGRADFLGIDTKSCSLCQLYYDQACAECPLYESRENFLCWEETEEEQRQGVPSPWHAWQQTATPEPMISALRLAQDWERRQAESDTHVKGLPVP